MTTKKKKSAKQRRVLIVALIVAAAIVAASTFAWFSSKDEVTNRLTASANYNVSIVEDFQPPADWLPGQTINKDVAAVNTGNVDAFVRMWLGGSLRVLKEDSTPANMVVAEGVNSAATGLTKVDDASKTKLGLNYYKNIGTTEAPVYRYYKTLSTAQIDNPQDANHAQNNGSLEENNEFAKFSEVQSMQAAGVLVYAPDDASYTWTLEQGTDLWVYSGANAEPTYTNIAKGTTVGSVSSTATTKIAGGSTAATAGGNYYGAIDASTFKPQTTGLYLFRRNIGETPDGTPNTYEYSGYYYDAAVDDTNGGTYFALYTLDGANGHSDYVLPEGVINDNSSSAPSSDQVLPVTFAANQHAYLSTATEDLYQTDDMTWTYNAAQKKFTIVKEVVNDKPISIEVLLTNVGTDAEQWTAIEDNATSNKKPQKTTFYYNNDLEAGDTTRKLVESVTLSEDTKVGAYLAFDFDLNVFLDSIQVTLDEAGKEGNNTVKDGWAVDVNTTTGGNDTLNPHPIMPAKGTISLQPGSEIEKMTWEIPTT